MLRRVLKSKQADRMLWLTLFLLTLLGVGLALKLSLTAEKRERWVGGEPPDSELEENPLAAGARHADSLTPAPLGPLRDSPPVPSPVSPTKIDTVAAKAPLPARSLAVEQFTTPLEPKVGAMTPACRNVMEQRGPWRDSQSAQPWPECQDADSNAMVVQLCTYARLANGEWVLSQNSVHVPRCRAEFPDVRSGKLRPIGAR
jgi:hypothetical protein